MRIRFQQASSRDLLRSRSRAVDEGGVKDQGVGDDGAGHARGLLAVLLVQLPGHRRQYLGTGRFAQLSGGRANAFLQDVRAFDEQPFGQGNVFNAGGQVVRTSGQPAFLRPAPAFIPCRPRVRAVAETRRLDALPQILLRTFAQLRRDLDGDGLFNRVAVDLQDLAQTSSSIGFDTARRRKLRLQDNRDAARGPDDQIRTLPPTATEDVLLLHPGMIAPARMLSQQHLVQLDVEGYFVGFGQTFIL